MVTVAAGGWALIWLVDAGVAQALRCRRCRSPFPRRWWWPRPRPPESVTGVPIRRGCRQGGSEVGVLGVMVMGWLVQALVAALLLASPEYTACQK